MRFTSEKDHNSSLVEERLEEDEAGVGKLVQPSRTEGKMVFAKAETVGMRQRTTEGTHPLSR